MNVVHFNKTYSQASVITTGSALLIYGPIPVDHLDNFAMYFTNSGTSTLYVKLKASFDYARQLEDNFPLGSFTTTQAIGVNPGQTVVRTLYGDGNPYRFITVLGSSTATLGTSESTLRLSGRTHK